MNHRSRHRARKRFGQNFLIDRDIIDRIITTIAPTPEDRLIEIGPGQGALTAPLLSRCPRLTVIELDRDLAALLRGWQQSHPGLTVVEADALRIDFSQFGDNRRSLRVVGNLPYNISTPLLFHLLSHSNLIRDMHFMLQREVVDRLSATPGEASYGRLSVMIQYHCRATPLLEVPPHSFRPAPKVHSMVVRLVPHDTLPYPCDAPSLLARLVNTCFQQRRKTLRNCLRNWVDPDLLEQLPIDLKARPETLSVQDFVNLANRLHHQGLNGSDT